MQDDVDALLQIAPVALAAIALACRLQARRGGALNEFLAILASIDRDRSTVLADINFLASMGRDLFAFWMLFWEVLLTTGDSCRI
jgi:hypothetical protein